MINSNDLSHRLVLWLAAWLIAIAGCSQEQQVASIVASKNDSNIQRLANLYRSYQLRHASEGPKDEAAFKDYIAHAMPAHRLKLMQVDANSIDGLFTSERDGQSFQVHYGVGGGLTSLAAVIFELHGVSGTRQVAFTDGSVVEVDEPRYQQLLKDPYGSNASVSAPPGAAP